jgi:hypothetical protein
MVPKLQQFLDKFLVTKTIVAYVKDEKSKLQTCVSALNSIVSCHNLAMLSNHLMVHVLDMHFQRHINL